MSSETSHNDWVISAKGLSKTYRLYDKPHHRLLQSLWRDRRQYYREFFALHDVSFQLARGETLGIIGRNGAGKSTLLQILCGTLTPSTGEVLVRGRIAALLELGTGFNPEFTGRENIAINAAILGLTPSQISDRFDDIIAFADIGQFIDQPVKTYSSGMYVRLAFAVIIHVQPDILVVDEALAVGDALFQAKCMSRMRRMLDDGVSLLFISHDIAAVKALCQRALWLQGGQVRALGTTAEVTRAYDQDWIRQANTAQGLEELSVPSSDAESNLLHAAAATAVQLLSWGWGCHNMLSSQARAAYGDVLQLRLRLRIQQPCNNLVVSYHIKNRQNQHVIGGHSADCTEVYGRSCQAGEIFELCFSIPIYLHEGSYALTVLVSSIGDVARYTDAIFHLWADDLGTLQVMPRPRFPLSDLVEPPVDFVFKTHTPWVVLDDFFPNLLTGFRVAEYNAHLESFPQLEVLSTLSDFWTEHERYAQHYPHLAQRVRPYDVQWLSGCGFAYINFLNNAAHFLSDLERHDVPFVLTLYPGGGFGLDENDSNMKLAKVLASPLLQALIATQPVTEAYLRRFAASRGLGLPPIYRIDGVVVNPQYFDIGLTAHDIYFGAGKSTLDICFVAERYMPMAANKGYPAVVEAIRALSDLPLLRFHVVGGGYTLEEMNGLDLGDRLQFHGRLETSSLRRFYAGMDLIISASQPGLLHPGNFDGFPTGCCVEAALSGVAVMASDALQQNPGYIDGENMLLLTAEPAGLALQIETKVRELVKAPQRLADLARAGQARTRELYSPARQIGERQRILLTIANQLGLQQGRAGSVKA